VVIVTPECALPVGHYTPNHDDIVQCTRYPWRKPPAGTLPAERDYPSASCLGKLTAPWPHGRGRSRSKWFRGLLMRNQNSHRCVFMGTLPSSAEKVLSRHRGMMSLLCAQCRKSMILVICEPDFHDSMVATYRCQECGLLDRAEVVLLRASMGAF
jgi:hypothetical protein